MEYGATESVVGREIKRLRTMAQENHSAAASRAKSSSFYLGMRILPPAQRQAMYEIYSFCRAVDDIADGDAPRAERIKALALWRKNIDALYTGHVVAGLEGLAHSIKGFSLRREDFLAVIDGMEMDAVADIRAPDMQTLDLYCDRVASAVGRLSVRVFGMQEDDGILLAHHLGRALQLTNILRDIDEDAELGRLYLPREALQRADIHNDDPRATASNPALGRACEFLLERARHHFAEADKIMSRTPRRLVRAPRIMERAYRRMLSDMVARGWNEPRRRVRVSRVYLLGIVLRYAFI
jgi:squalene synthase HpnD